LNVAEAQRPKSPGGRKSQNGTEPPLARPHKKGNVTARTTRRRPGHRGRPKREPTYKNEKGGAGKSACHRGEGLQRQLGTFIRVNLTSKRKTGKFCACIPGRNETPQTGSGDTQECESCHSVGAHEERRPPGP